jgi:hypothetical protein
MSMTKVYSILLSPFLFAGLLQAQGSRTEMGGPHMEISEGQICFYCQSKAAGLTRTEANSIQVHLMIYNNQVEAAKKALVANSKEVLPKEKAGKFAAVVNFKRKGQANIVGATGSATEKTESKEKLLVKSDSRTVGQLNLPLMAKFMRLRSSEKKAIAPGVEEYNATIAKAKNELIQKLTDVLPEFKQERFNKALLSIKK